VSHWRLPQVIRPAAFASIVSGSATRVPPPLSPRSSSRPAPASARNRPPTDRDILDWTARRRYAASDVPKVRSLRSSTCPRKQSPDYLRKISFYYSEPVTAISLRSPRAPLVPTGRISRSAGPILAPYWPHIRPIFAPYSPQLLIAHYESYNISFGSFSWDKTSA
jgi:hypothetical protein